MHNNCQVTNHCDSWYSWASKRSLHCEQMCLPSFIFSFYPGQISFPADHLFYYAICHFPPMLQDYPPNVLYIVIFSLYSLYCKNDTSLVSIHMNISLNSISLYCKNGTSQSLTFTHMIWIYSLKFMTTSSTFVTIKCLWK